MLKCNIEIHCHTIEVVVSRDDILAIFMIRAKAIQVFYARIDFDDLLCRLTVGFRPHHR